MITSKELFNKIIKNKGIQRYLNFLKEYHKETYEHCLRVTLRSIKLGRKNRLNGFELRTLVYGALLHDIGKTKIPIDILSKKFSLSNSERRVMEGHVRLGFLELGDQEYKTVKKIVISHHEFKKNPYPRKIKDRRRKERKYEDRREKDEKIEKMSQIVATIDIYDALSSRRSYKEPISNEKIEKIMLKQFTGDSKYINQIFGMIKNDSGF